MRISLIVAILTAIFAVALGGCTGHTSGGKPPAKLVKVYGAWP